MPAAAAPANATVAADPPRRRGIVGLVLKALAFLVAAALLVAGGFAAGWFFFAQPSSPLADALKLIERPASEAAAEDEPAAEEGMPRAPRPLPEQPSFVTTYYTFAEPLTTNLAGSRRYLQVTVALSTQYDPKVMTHVETHKVPLQSDILAVLGTFTEEDLAGKDGRDRLAEAVKGAINTRLTALEGFGGIEGVWFPSFVLQ